MNPSKNTIKRLKRISPEEFKGAANDLDWARQLLTYLERHSKYRTPQHYNIKADFAQSADQQVELWIDSPIGFKHRIEHLTSSKGRNQ